MFICYSILVYLYSDEPYYAVVAAVVGTTSSCDTTGFEASGAWRWQEELSCFCHIADLQISKSPIGPTIKSGEAL